MQINVLFAQNQSDLARWNKFVLKAGSTSFFTISHWFNSYSSFGMQAKYILATNSEDVVVGGAALSVFRLGPLIWIQVPHGPVLLEKDDFITCNLIQEIENFARKAKAFLVEIQPFETSRDHHTLQQAARGYKLDYSPNILATSNVGVSNYLYENGYACESYVNVFRAPMEGQIVWVTQNDLLAGFRKGTRRDIRYSLNSNIRLVKADTIELLREAYDVLIENGKRKGYPIRPWESFVQPLSAAIKDDSAVVLMAEKDGQYLSAVVVGFGGHRGAYLMGGTRRSKNDKVYPAHFLQYQAMQETLVHGYEDYDLTAIGNVGDKGVAVFKRGFRPNYYKLVGKFTKVFYPDRLKLYLRIQPFLRNNRRNLARILSMGKSLIPKNGT